MREIFTDTRLAYSKAFIFVMENFVEILKQGHSELSLCINNSMMVTYAIDNGEVVGACVYEIDAVKRQAWIYTAGVAAAHRGQGIYDDIYSEVEHQCRNAGMLVLNSNIHVDNAGMIANAKKHGRLLSWYRTSKQL